MNKILLGALLGIVLGAAAGAIVIASGVIDVGADTPHNPAFHQALTFARERSIARSAADIKAPDNLNDPERVRRGAGNYDAMCVGCHLAPELADSEIRRGLYPAPPNLSEKRDALSEQHAARDFWIIKHGIKATGMPAWSKGGMDDEAIWDLVAFLQKMPTLSKASYEQLVAASDGHSHGGMTGAADDDGGHREAPQPPSPGKGASHDHDAHDHSKHKH
jgi:hypothetical protein